MNRNRESPNLFHNWLELLARDYGERLAVTCDEDALCYSELVQASRGCALKLRRQGLQKGDRVILSAVNGVDWIVSFFGILLAGGVAASANYRLNREDTITITRLVGAGWAILGPEDAYAEQRAAQALCDGGIPANRILSCRELYSDALKTSVDESELRLLTEGISPRDTQVILFTSGSTAIPKAVALSSEAILTNTYGFVELIANDVGKIGCPPLPLFHAFGMIVMMMLFDVGAVLCLTRELTPQAVLEQIDKRHADTLFSVGTIYRMLIELPEFHEKGKGKIKSCIWSASGMTPADMERLQQCLGGAQILPCYGLSECAAAVSISESGIPPERRAVTVGRPLPNLDVRIWSENRGFLPQGELGEIIIHGPCLMNGYFGLPTEEQPIDKNGWLHTGDLGLITEDGLLQLRGRLKTLIKRAGENIAPAEIEEALLEESSICDAKVIGLEHPILGESVEACVVLRDGELNEQRLRAFLRKRLSPFKVPSHILAFPAFPLNTNGKVDQLRLKELVAERLREQGE